MKRFKNILLVNKGGSDQTWALARGVALAEKNQAELSVIEIIPALPEELQEETIASIFTELKVLTEPYRQRLNIHLDVRMGKEFLEVIRAVLRRSHDLVITVAESPDFVQRLFGSSDMHLLRKCPCPLWLMKPAEERHYQNILAAVDFNPHQPDPEALALNRQIVELAASLALGDGATLHLVHAWHAFGERAIQSRGDSIGKKLAGYAEKELQLHQNGLRQLGTLLRDSLAADGYSSLLPQFHLLKGAPQRLIPQLAVDLHADLLVMGTVARTGIMGVLIGNTAETILDQLNCSVLAVKPEGFVTPVTLPK
jgi:universal stress protein E